MKQILDEEELNNLAIPQLVTSEAPYEFIEPYLEQGYPLHDSLIFTLILRNNIQLVKKSYLLILN